WIFGACELPPPHADDTGPGPDRFLSNRSGEYRPEHVPTPIRAMELLAAAGCRDQLPGSALHRLRRQLAGPDALGRRLPSPFTFAVVAQATLRQPHAGVKQERRLPAPFRTAAPGQVVR